ncbi:MAG: hypothetical protein IPI34_00935 [bacterium]|nr:hypothetical protein [bacterium]
MHTVARQTDGTLWAWGHNEYDQLGDGTGGGAYYAPTQIGTADTWASVTAGNWYAIACQTDGTLWAWGYN